MATLFWEDKEVILLNFLDCVAILEKRGAYKILVGRPEGRRPLDRPRRRWENNMKMDLQDVERSMDWIELAQDRGRWRALVNAVMNCRVP
jgi:hypothetical protein